MVDRSYLLTYIFCSIFKDTRTAFHHRMEPGGEAISGKQLFWKIAALHSYDLFQNRLPNINILYTGNISIMKNKLLTTFSILLLLTAGAASANEAAAQAVDTATDQATDKAKSSMTDEMTDMAKDKASEAMDSAMGKGKEKAADATISDESE